MDSNEKSLTRRRNKAELIEQLKIQIRLLQNNAKQYDGGFQEASITMATILRTLLWENSLLSKIGIRKQIDFLNTAYPYEETNLLTQHGLVGMHISNAEARFVPHYDSGYKQKYKYKDWMNETVICDKKRNLFRRKQLIQIIANKDGGAHVDSDIPADYAELKENNSINWEKITPDGSKPLDNDVVYASIRQMTYEVLESLYNYNSGWFTETYF